MCGLIGKTGILKVNLSGYPVSVAIMIKPR